LRKKTFLVSHTDRNIAKPHTARQQTMSVSTFPPFKVNATICQLPNTASNNHCAIHHLITHLLAVIAVATNVGKYEGNQEDKRFYSRNCTGSRLDSIS
jgi:hypothetical protein